jgi:hypothetical protein
MQSGRAKTKAWKLTFEESNPKFVENLMGWIGGSDTQADQVELSFPSKEDAIAYAEKHGLHYRVSDPKTRRIKPKSYADNFKYNRIKT